MMLLNILALILMRISDGRCYSSLWVAENVHAHIGNRAAGSVNLGSRTAVWENLVKRSCLHALLYPECILTHFHVGWVWTYERQLLPSCSYSSSNLIQAVLLWVYECFPCIAGWFPRLQNIKQSQKERTACAFAEREPDRRCGLLCKNPDVLLVQRKRLISDCKGLRVDG